MFVLLAFLDIVHILSRSRGISFHSRASPLGINRCAGPIRGAAGVVRSIGGVSVTHIPRRAAGIIRAAGIVRLPAAE